LLAQANREPNNVDNWKALGRAYVSAGSFALAGNAFEKAYELTQGKDVEVLTGLAEALVLTDQTSLNGRVGVLIDQALQLQPKNPKALWYGGLVALQMENLPLARDRFTTMLALGPPPQIRTLLERQIQDLNQQLGDASASAATPPAAPTNASARKVTVKVSLSPALQQQLKGPVSLFILARNPAQPGPPLAVERHQSSELPLQVELSAEDAMLPSRTLASAQEIQIVARLSASGTPTEQSGDLFGTVGYSFAKQGEQGSVTIEINQRVP
jgi:cytochrome c-type biogenesis protein CcmH